MSDDNNETNTLLRVLIDEFQRPRKEAEAAAAAAEEEVRLAKEEAKDRKMISKAYDAALEEDRSRRGMFEKMGDTFKEMLDFQKMRAKLADRKTSVGGNDGGGVPKFEKVDISGLKKLPGIGLILDIIGDIGDIFTKTLLPLFKNLFRGVLWFANTLAVPIALAFGFFHAFKVALEEVEKVMDGDGNGLQLALAGILGAIKGFFGFFLGLADTVAQWIADIALEFLGEDNFITNFFDGWDLKGVFDGIMDWLIKWIVHPIDSLKELFKPITDWFKEQWATFTTGLDTAWTGIKNFFSAWYESIKTDLKTIEDFFKSVGDWFSEKFDAMLDFIDKSWMATKIFFAIMSDVVLDAWDDIKDFFSSVGAWFKEKFDAMLAFVDQSWVSTKAFFVTVNDAVVEGLDDIKDFFSSIGSWFKEKFDAMIEGISAAWESTKLFFSEIKDTLEEKMTALKDWFASIPAWFKEKFTAIGETLTTALTDISASISKFFEDPLGSVKSIIMAPWNLFKSAISWISEALGFGPDGKGEGDIDELEKEEEGILASVLKLLFAPHILLTKALDFLLGKLGFESLREYIPDVGAMLSKAADWVSGLLGDAIAWFQDKLSFFGGGDEAPDMDTQSGRKTAAENDGLVNNPLIGSATIDEKALKGMSNEQLAQLAEDWSGYKKIEKSIEKELASRLNGSAAKQPGNVGTAISAPAVPESRNPAPSSVTGSVQDYAQIASEMYTAQENLSQSKSKQGNFAAAPMIVGGSDNSTVNNTTMNTFTSPAPPSSRDYYDYNTAFKQSR